MKRVISILGTIVLFAFETHAAVSFMLHASSGMEFRATGVWNMTVQSTADKPILVRFRATVKNERGNVLVNLESEPRTIDPGVSTLNSFNVATAKITYLSVVLRDYESTTGSFPPGAYSYCVTLVCMDKTCLQSGDLERNILECNQVLVESPTPLLLQFPEHESILEELRPTFNWIPPMPSGSDPSMTYRIILCDLKEGQSLNAAIRRNRPLFARSGLETIQLPFPSELDDLVEGQSYAWQVQAFLGELHVATSEVWNFKIAKRQEPLPQMPWVRLKKYDRTQYVAVNDLKFVFNETLRSGNLSFRILDNQGVDVAPKGVSLSTTQGDNKFKMDLNAFGLTPNESYKLIIQRSDGQSFTLKFKYVHQYKTD